MPHVAKKNQVSSNVQAMFKHYTIRRQKWRNIQANQSQKRCKTANDFETFDIGPSSDRHQTIIFFSRPFLSSKLHGLSRLEHFFCPKARRVLKPQSVESESQKSLEWVESPSTTSMAFSAKESFYAHLSAFFVM